NILKQIDQLYRNSSRLGTYMSEFIGAGDWRLSFIFRDRVEDMTLDKVNEAIKKYYIKTNRTVGEFIPTKDPVRVGVPRTEDVEELVDNYKGKEGYGTGEAFDVSYDNIENRLDTGKLDKTGIEYGFIKKDNRGKTVNISFVIRNGNVNQLMNKGVTAQYVANMLDKGTKSKTRQDIEDKLSELKSSVRFRGSNGRVYAYVNSTEDNLMETLSLMADMLKNPSFDATELDKLKTENLARIEQNKSEPGFLAQTRMGQINQHYPKGHPLHNMSIEEQIEAINAVNTEDLQAYYNDFYGISNNATLTAIGNIDEDKLKAFFEIEFGNFKCKNSYTEISDAYQDNTAANESIKTPDKKNAFTFGTLDFKCSKYDENYAALQMAGAIFGGGFLNSRLATRLRQKDGVSYGVGGYVSVDDDKEDKNSSVMIYAIYAPQNAQKVQKGFKEEIERFIKDGITEEELKNAVNGWIQAQSVSRAKDNELSSTINNNLYYDRDLNFQKNIEEKVKSLTVDDVNRAIKKYFKPLEDWTVVNAGDFNNMIEVNDNKVDD
ncbi:MAG TPA: pitrilysin family protein, partial [Flavobacteriaceae bacterium]|nr:pitrilysin family protein [Flavobacteriaceae bacterium]